VIRQAKTQAVRQAVARARRATSLTPGYFLLIIFAIIAVAIWAIIGIDIFLAVKYGWNSTLSWWIYTNSVQYPIIPAMIGFTFGLLMAHFFWNQALNVTVTGGTSQ
jgi:hypothetical protein